MLYNSITLNFEENSDSEFLGESSYTMPLVAFKQAFAIYSTEVDRGSVYSEFENLLEDQDESDEQITFYSPDLFITILYYLGQNNCITTIDCTYSDFIWLVHDVSHAINDVYGDVSIDDNAECRAIEDSIKFLATNNLPMPYHVLAQTEKEFLERFAWQPYFVQLAKDHSNFINYNNLTLDASKI